MNLPICDSIIVEACHRNCKVPKESWESSDKNLTIVPQLHAIITGRSRIS